MTISGNKLRWLFWLRWKLFLRSYTRGGASRIIGAISLVIFVLLFGGGLAFASFMGYRFADAPINREILFLVLTALFVLWTIFPLVAININEGLDLSKLALFPLTRGELMLSLLVSTLLDISTIGLILMLGAVVLGWGLTLAMGLMALLTVIVFYIHLIAVSQLVLALLQPLLQSRRFRDVMILMTVVLGSSGYICNLALQGNSLSIAETVINGSISPYLQWLPSGMAARAIEQASIGNWGISFVWLGALVVLTIGFLYLGLVLIERAQTAVAENQPQAQSVRRRSTDGTQASTGFWGRFLPPQIAMIMSKDLKYYWRDPQLKSIFLQSLLSIVFLIVVAGYNQVQFSRIDSQFAGLSIWTELWAPNAVLLSIFTLAYNMLGYERGGLTTLLLFPIKPLYILWAKNLLLFLLGIVQVVIVAIVVGFLTQGWILFVPALVSGLAGIAIMLALGNFMSVFFPQRMPPANRTFSFNQNMSLQEGCLRGLVSLLAMIVSLILLAPIFLGIVLPFVFNALWIWAIVLPASLAYGALIYFGITALVAPRIQTRTPEILAVVTRE